MIKASQLPGPTNVMCTREIANRALMKTRKYLDMVEKIQRRATKLILGLKDLRYEERLNECVLTTLETRRLGGGVK